MNPSNPTQAAEKFLSGISKEWVDATREAREDGLEWEWSKTYEDVLELTQKETGRAIMVIYLWDQDFEVAAGAFEEMEEL